MYWRRSNPHCNGSRRDKVALRTTRNKNVKFKIIDIWTSCQYVGYLYCGENVKWAAKKLWLGCMWPRVGHSCSWWRSGPILWLSEWFISTWYFSSNAIFSVLVSCGWMISTTVWAGFPTIAFVATIYLCESGFSALAHIRTKARNQSIVEHDKRLALSSTQPRISKFAIRLQSQPLHWKCLWNSLAVWN